MPEPARRKRPCRALQGDAREQEESCLVPFPPLTYMRKFGQKLSTASVRIIHRITQSAGATGGVYKGQGRNQHELMTRA